jgi:hypothetical protein
MTTNSNIYRAAHYRGPKKKIGNAPQGTYDRIYDYSHLVWFLLSAMTWLMTENGISHMVTLCPFLVINPSHISYVFLVVQIANPNGTTSFITMTSWGYMIFLDELNSSSDTGALEYTCLSKTRHIHTHSMLMFCNSTLIHFLCIDVVQENQSWKK